MRAFQRMALTVAVLLVHYPLQAQQSSEVSQIKNWLGAYDAAFVAKDLARLATFYHPEVTIFEEGGANNGWADYRDNHLGPELKAYENLRFSTTNVVVHLFGDGRSAYVTSEYLIKAKWKGRDDAASGLQTMVLLKSGDGTWKIRHSHTSSRRPPQ